MDHSTKKKQERLLVKIKSWSKKLVTPPNSPSSPKSNSNIILTDNNEQSRWSCPSLDGVNVNNNNYNNLRSQKLLSTNEKQKTSKIFKQEKLNSFTKNSFFGLRLNSRLSSCISRISNTTTVNNLQHSNLTTCTLPELIQDSFDFDSIFNDFDQLCKVNESDELGVSNELNDPNNNLLMESINNLSDLNEIEDDLRYENEEEKEEEEEEEEEEELYNALPVIEEEEFIVQRPNVNQKTLSIIYPPSISETPLRLSIIGVECLVCRFTNHPIMTYCECCNARLPVFTDRSSQYSIAQSTFNNNKSIISEIILSPIIKTQMIPLKKDDDDYITVKEIFYSEMPQGFINVKGIFRLDMPTKLTKAHEKYKSKIAKLSGKTIDEVTFSMFHGTTTSPSCNPDRFLKKDYSFSDKSFCKRGCGMCGIIQHGNRKKFSKHNKKMWFAHSSLISRDYTDSNRRTKVMFVVDVVSKRHNGILEVNKNKATLPRFMILF